MNADRNNFKTEDGPEPFCEPRIRWRDGNAYAAIELGSPGAITPLPGRSMFIDDALVRKQPDTLLLSERSGGSRALLDWWRGRLDRQGVRENWLLVHAREWASDFFDWSPDLVQETEKLPAELQSLKKGAISAIEEFRKRSGSSERAQVLAKWSRKLSSPFTLIIRDLMNLGLKESMEVATALRSIRDHKLAENLRIVLVSHSEEVLTDFYDRSGYLPLLRQVRVPSLTVKEVRDMSAYEGKRTNPCPLTESAANAVLDETGGQPLLVQVVLKILGDQSRIPWSVQVDKEHIIEAARHLRETPLSPATIWCEDLFKILSKSPDLVPRMRSYVVGNTLGPSRFPPPLDERPLFVAGWLGINRRERWGIRSAFHAHLARPILDKFPGGGSQ